jgi:hypothetical protein
MGWFNKYRPEKVAWAKQLFLEAASFPINQM